MQLLLKRRALLAAGSGLIFARSRQSVAQSRGITGGGSNFFHPVVQRWIEQCPTSLGVQATYSVLGTAVAQSKLLAGDIDFAATELTLPAPLLDESGLLQFPMVFGALAVVVNVQGIGDAQLRLNGALLAAIYSGQIKKWNDPRIIALNPGLALPDQDVRPLNLGTPDGRTFSTTVTLQQYLLATDAAWRARHGAVVTKRWAVGSMVTNAAAMTENMRVMPGAIGYMALGQAVQDKLPMAMLVNKAGKAVAPGINGLRAAVAQVDWRQAPGMVANVLDLPGAETWPIVLTTYALIKKTPLDTARGTALRVFMRYGVTTGANSASERHAAALPAGAQAQVLQLLS